MQVLLLLTLDPGLEREIEKAWEDGTFLTLDSPDSVASALKSLESRPLLLVDTTCFPLPENSEADLICVGEEVLPGVALLERPIRPKELHALASSFSAQSGQGGGRLEGILPSPFAEFQRDAIHDLNNQFTTLQGNLMLLQEDMKDPALEDMAGAASKALRLIQWLEWLGEGEFASEPVDLLQLLEDLSPLFFRLRNRKTTFQVESSETASLPVHADPQKLLALLLVLTHSIPGEPESCRVSLAGSGRNPVITCSWQETREEVTLPEIVTAWCSALRITLTVTRNSWALEW